MKKKKKKPMGDNSGSFLVAGTMLNVGNADFGKLYAICCNACATAAGTSRPTPSGPTSSTVKNVKRRTT